MDDVNREMTHYKGFKPELAEIMELYAELLAVEAEYLEKIDPGIQIDEIVEIEQKIAEGKSLLDTRTIDVDPVLFKEVLTKMANIVAEKSPEFKEPLDRLISHPDLNVDTEGAKPIFIDALLNFNTQYFTKIAELIGLNEDILFFLIYHAISPFIEKAAILYRDTFDYRAWQKTTCPVCGRKPSMSVLRREDGLHILQCQVCRTQWSYPRSTCVVCGNNDNETYKYLYDESDEAHRAYVCDACKKYVKTTDARALDRDVDIEVEDLATMVLDFVAKERGYEPGGRVTFAVSLEIPEDDGDIPVEITVD
jgi:FdhE protein